MARTLYNVPDSILADILANAEHLQEVYEDILDQEIQCYNADPGDTSGIRKMSVRLTDWINLIKQIKE